MTCYICKKKAAETINVDGHIICKQGDCKNVYYAQTMPRSWLGTSTHQEHG